MIPIRKPSTSRKGSTVRHFVRVVLPLLTFDILCFTGPTRDSYSFLWELAMGSRSSEVVSGKPEACVSEDGAMREALCSNSLTTPDSKLVSAALSESTKNLLSGFSIDYDTAQDAALTTAGTALAVGLAGAGVKTAQIGGEKIAAVAADIPVRMIGAFVGNSEIASGALTREVLAQPFAPRVVGAGLKFGLYGAAAGLTAYGLYEGYQYLNSSDR